MAPPVSIWNSFCKIRYCFKIHLGGDWRQHVLIFCSENFEIIIVRKKINTVRQNINTENFHRPDILTEC